jgi:hypothetical protein
MTTTRKMSESEREAKTPIPEAIVTPTPPITRTVEEWATPKGMYPQFSEPGELRFKRPQDGGPMEFAGLGGALASVKPRGNPKYPLFYAAQIKFRWPQGMELTESEFDAAVDSATNTPI